MHLEYSSICNPIISILNFFVKFTIWPLYPKIALPQKNGLALCSPIKQKVFDRFIPDFDTT